MQGRVDFLQSRLYFLYLVEHFFETSLSAKMRNQFMCIRSTCYADPLRYFARKIMPAMTQFTCPCCTLSAAVATTAVFRMRRNHVLQRIPWVRGRHTRAHPRHT